MPDDSAGPGPPQGAPAPPDQSGTAPPPGGPPQGGPPGGGTLAPQGAPGSQPVAALGQQAMARAKLRMIVHTLHREIFPIFELNSDEGKAVHKALSALKPFGGGGDDKEGGDKNSAMASLMQRAMAAKAAGGGGGGGQTPQPNRGPIPTMAGT